MESLEKFRLQIIFRNISYLIANKIVDFPQSSQIFLLQADNFFENLIKSLHSLEYRGSMVQSENNNYHFLPNLKEIVNISEHDSVRLRNKDLRKIIDYFIWVRSEINKLNTNPNDFYSSSSFETIKDTIYQISEIYTENHLFFQNESELKSNSTITA